MRISEQPLPFMGKKRGSSHHKAKLTEKKVIAIRKAYDEGADPTDLAKQYGVVRSTVREILKGNRWNHVPLGEREYIGRKVGVYTMRNGKRYLTSDQANQIRRKFEKGESFSALRSEYDLSWSNLYDVLNNKTFIEVPLCKRPYRDGSKQNTEERRERARQDIIQAAVLIAKEVGIWNLKSGNIDAKSGYRVCKYFESLKELCRIIEPILYPTEHIFKNEDSK